MGEEGRGREGSRGEGGKRGGERRGGNQGKARERKKRYKSQPNKRRGAQGELWKGSKHVESGCITLPGHQYVTRCTRSCQHGNSLKFCVQNSIGISLSEHDWIDWITSSVIELNLQPLFTCWGPVDFTWLKAPTLHLSTCGPLWCGQPHCYKLFRGPPSITEILLSLWRFQRFIAYFSRTREKSQPNLSVT